MFTKPINEITFEDIENFCNEWTEGVRVEYKSKVDVQKHIPKTVSAFANTLGGFFLIGVTCDKVKNEVIAIDGIPSKNGIGEQIIQCAYKKIYPAVIPSVAIIDVPNSNNVVVVVRVDESVQAPHTINNTTKVYIRTEDISHPEDHEELAKIDRIEYMFKRRENSQIAVQHILNRIEEHSEHLLHRGSIPAPVLTLIVQPIFPYRPIISPSTIYELHEQQHTPPKRVDGGVCYFRDNEFIELNEYGIVYHRTILPPSEDKEIRFDKILFHIDEFLRDARTLYKESEYQGNLDFKVGLRQTNKCKLTGRTPDGIDLTRNLSSDLECSFDLDVALAKRCLSHDLENKEGRKEIAEELIWKLLWIFNIAVDKETVRERFSGWIDNYVN